MKLFLFCLLDNDSADGSSPSKKTRTDTSETEVESDSSKKEIVCPLCPKTFPSPNSLSTHIQHHNLENRMRKVRPTIFEFKHKCMDCETTFKNGLLLNRHVCPKQQNTRTTTTHLCDICKKKFDSQISVNVHKKIHEAGGSTQTFPKPSSAAKRLTLVPKKSSNIESNGFGTKKPPPHRTSYLPHRQTLLPMDLKDGTDKYKCEKCDQTFKNGILLKKHVCPTEKTHQYKCAVCGLSFKDNTVFNIHKRKHIKETLIKTTSEVNISPMKYLPVEKRNIADSSRKTLSHLKAVNKGSPSFKVFSVSNIDFHVGELQEQ